MDPNELVGLLLAYARGLVDCPAPDLDPDDARELAQACLDLDDWLCRGGGLPARWCEYQQKGTL